MKRNCSTEEEEEEEMEEEEEAEHEDAVPEAEHPAEAALEKVEAAPQYVQISAS